MTSPLVAPVLQTERITILDSLRGFAILGILLMNIPGFALPDPAAYGDLSVMNEIGTPNFKVWYGIDWFLEGSQRALFSMLFGAGIILFITGKEKKAEGLWPADYFFRRQLWLLVFGLFNAFILLWFWDILFHYAVLGLVAFAFRRQSAKFLMIGALVFLFLQTARDNVDAYRERKVITKGEAIAKMDTTVTKLTDVQKEELGAMTAFKERSTAKAKAERMKKSLAAVQGSYPNFYNYQSERSVRGELFYTYYGFGDILLMMFLGMAFFKNGWITGQASAKVYWALFVVGLGLGLVLSYFRLQPYIEYNFNQFD
ncbi:MAG: hypothetical protein V4676_08825, partial [Bacteroidota bacterium]